MLLSLTHIVARLIISLKYTSMTAYLPRHLSQTLMPHCFLVLSRPHLVLQTFLFCTTCCPTDFGALIWWTPRFLTYLLLLRPLPLSFHLRWNLICLRKHYFPWWRLAFLSLHMYFRYKSMKLIFSLLFLQFPDVLLGDIYPVSYITFCPTIILPTIHYPWAILSLCSLYSSTPEILFQKSASATPEIIPGDIKIHRDK